jgi:ribosomal protein S6--L-glutamate ligase
MLRLAVANKTETFERIQEPLAARNIEVRHLPYHERTEDLQDPSHGPQDFDVGFVFPGRAMEGGVVDAATEIPWINGRDAVLTSRNKAEVILRLDRAGLPTPRTVFVSNPVPEEDVREAARRLDFPVVIKPNSTTRGIGVAKVHDLDSLFGVIDYLDLVHDYRATGDKTYLLQEFHPDATDLRVMVLDGAYAGAVQRTFPDGLAEERWKHNVHRGATADGVQLDADLRRIAEDAATALNIPLVGVDLLAGPEGVVVNETNARPTIDVASKYAEDFYDRFAELIRTTAG